MHAHEASAHVELAAQVGTGCRGEGKMSADNQQINIYPVIINILKREAQGRQSENDKDTMLYRQDD